jgi:GNAT superfamily N-acetyltransferase
MPGAAGGPHDAAAARGAPGTVPGAGELRLVTLVERPDLVAAMHRHASAAWPEFMLHDAVVDAHWQHLDRELARWQLLLLDGPASIVATANSAPFTWDGTSAGLPAGWDDQFERTAADLQAGRAPTVLGALQIVVSPERRGDGLAGRMIAALRALAADAGLAGLVACVRPTDKHLYPLVPIDRYAAWTRPDGAPFDAWIRLHVRLGGRIDRPAPSSMTIRGSVGEWETWTGMSFPDSGDYVVPLATRPVSIDREADRGTYCDENVWIVHDPA